MTTTLFTPAERLHLIARSRGYQTRIERAITLALAGHAHPSSNGLVGEVTLLVTHPSLEERILAWLEAQDITVQDVRCGLLLLQQRQCLTIRTQGAGGVVLILTPSALAVDPRDTEPYWGFSELEAA